MTPTYAALLSNKHTTATAKDEPDALQPVTFPSISVGSVLTRVLPGSEGRLRFVVEEVETKNWKVTNPNIKPSVDIFLDHAREDDELEIAGQDSNKWIQVYYQADPRAHVKAALGVSFGNPVDDPMDAQESATEIPIVAGCDVTVNFEMSKGKRVISIIIDGKETASTQPLTEIAEYNWQAMLFIQQGLRVRLLDPVEDVAS